MQLKLQRSQRFGGITGGTVLFCLDVRADYSPEEQGNIRKYRIGNQLIYSSRAAQRHFENAGAHLDRAQEGTAGNRAAGLARGVLSVAMAKMSLNISLDSLGRGHHIECKDLEELLEAEDTVRNACRNVTRFLEVARTFDGSEIVVEYDNGEELVHVSHVDPSRFLSSGRPPAQSVATSKPSAPPALPSPEQRDLSAPSIVAESSSTPDSAPAPSGGDRASTAALERVLAEGPYLGSRPAVVAETAEWTETVPAASGPSGAAYDFEQAVMRFWSNPGSRKLAYYGGAVLLAILFLRSCF